jgi:hypothetical protein
MLCLIGAVACFLMMRKGHGRRTDQESEVERTDETAGV